jgi:hypothetical protein
VEDDDSNGGWGGGWNRRLERRQAGGAAKGAAPAQANTKPADPAAKPMITKDTPLVVKPMDKEVVVVKSDNIKLTPNSADRSDLINLRATSPMPSVWLKKNGILESIARRLELISFNITEGTNKIVGYMSPSCLMMRSDLMVKLVKEDGVRDFCIKLGNTKVLATSTNPNAAQAVANVLARIDGSVKNTINAPIADVASAVAKITGPPATIGATSPFQNKDPEGKPINIAALKASTKVETLGSAMAKVTTNQITQQTAKSVVATEKREDLKQQAVEVAKNGGDLKKEIVPVPVQKVPVTTAPPAKTDTPPAKADAKTNQTPATNGK